MTLRPPLSSSAPASRSSHITFRCWGPGPAGTLTTRVRPPQTLWDPPDTPRSPQGSFQRPPDHFRCKTRTTKELYKPPKALRRLLRSFSSRRQSAVPGCGHKAAAVSRRVHFRYPEMPLRQPQIPSKFSQISFRCPLHPSLSPLEALQMPGGTWLGVPSLKWHQKTE